MFCLISSTSVRRVAGTIMVSTTGRPRRSLAALSLPATFNNSPCTGPIAGSWAR